MELVVTRNDFRRDCTIGTLTVNGTFFCYTLEDVVRPPSATKVYGQTAIPYGMYEVQITKSKRFGIRLPLLINVPNFMGVRIHAGNTAAHTEGCILVGYQKYNDSILKSRPAIADLLEDMEDAVANGETINLTINEEGIGDFFIDPKIRQYS
jgi:hypothetical protein